MQLLSVYASLAVCSQSNNIVITRWPILTKYNKRRAGWTTYSYSNYCNMLAAQYVRGRHLCPSKGKPEAETCLIWLAKGSVASCAPPVWDGSIREEQYGFFC